MTSLPAVNQAVPRIRAFCFGVIGIAYYYAARTIAEHAAAGLAPADWIDLVDRLMLLFLLVVGFGLLGYFQQQRRPLHDLGLKQRPGWQREFGVGAALGWGTLVVAILPLVLTGGLFVTLWGAPRQWFLLLLDLFVLLVASLAEEMVFRGYALQRFTESLGASGAALLIALTAAILQYGDAFAPRASVWVAFFLGWLLSLGFQRTRALWLPWGFRFAWYASTSLLFGLPIAGVSRYTPVVQSTAHGSDWLTGGDYGPESATITVFISIAAIFVLLRVTRDYAYRYATPEIVAAGIPVDIDAISKRQHEVGMGPVVEPASVQLVQIAGLEPASSPGPSAPSEPSPTTTHAHTSDREPNSHPH